MKYPVAVQYSHPGAQPPVYIAGSWTNPPWEPQEMAVSDQKTEDGHLRFVKHFDAVEEGEYQYKFRLGPGDWWVTDETAPTVTDASGNSNNKLVVKPPPQKTESPSIAESTSQPSDMDAKSPSNELLSHDTPNDPIATAPAQGQSEAEAKLAHEQPKDISASAGQSSAEPKTSAVEDAPIPFTVVETVPDQEQPVYGDLEAVKLKTDESKRTEDAEPDFEYERPPTAPAAESTSERAPSNPEIPHVVVEKTDDTLRHGDDFGSEATSGQKLAHAMRKADAEPDETLISPTASPEDAKDATADGNKASDDVPTDISGSGPLLPHESLDPVEDDDVELEVPLLSHERSIESDADNILRRNDSATSTMEPVKVEGDTPIFSHELLPDDPPFSPTFSMPRNRSTASLRSMRSLKSIDADEDENDPSLERFPTEREEIYEHIRRTESRLPEDSSIIEDGHSSPVRNGEPSPGLISTSVGHSSPLNPITEDDQDADLDEEDGPSNVRLPGPITPLAGTKPEEERDQDAPLTPPLTPKDKARDSEPTPNENPKLLDNSHLTADDLTESEASADELREEESSGQDQPTTLAEPEGPRQRKHSPSSRATAPSRRSPSPPVVKSNEGFFRAFWRALFGSWLAPLTQWLLGILGHKQNTA